MEKWNKATLSDVCDLVAGFAFKSKDFGSYESRVIKIANIIPPSVDMASLVGVDLEKYDKPKLEKYIARKGDVVLAMTGATIGKIGRIEYGQAYINQRVLLFRPKEIIDQDYLYYVLQQHKFLQYVVNHVDSESAQPNISAGTVGKYQIYFPPMDLQKKIGRVLRTYDELIELNRKINENLEQQAQSYFQELFVDNANPEWTTGTISNLGTVVGGSTPSKAKPEYYTEAGIAWITPKDLSINKSKFVSHGENDITELGLKNSSAAIMPEGTVLFSSRAPIGYIAIAAGEVTTNQGFKSVVPKSEIGTPFVYFFLKNSLPVIEGMASGSTFKEVSGSTMKNVPAVIPDAKTLARFSDFCAPIFAQQRILEEQNQSLAALRDNLLLKLMSGELDVSDIQL